MRRTASCCLYVACLLAMGAASGDDGVTHPGDDRHERVPLSTVAPAYPERSSTNRVFEKPAIRAIRASRYQSVPKEQEVPAIKTCRTFRFRLESATAG